jgi:hypothetical protein
MMKKITLNFLFLALCLSSFSQVTEKEDKLKSQNADTLDGWKKGGIIAINFTQTSLNNWAAGGQNSVSVNGLFNYFLNFKKENNAWDNSLDIGYGLLKQGKNASWWKTDDRIDFMSKYGKKASKSWYYAGLMNFRTQMAPGYNFPNDSVKISDLLAPGYLLAALGMDYKPNAFFSLFIAPATVKTTFVLNQELADAGAFGVSAAEFDNKGRMIKSGENIRYEFGGYLRMLFKKDIMKNINFQTKLDLFSNYLYNPQNIDVSWETLTSFKVNDFFSASIFTHLIYDDDIKIQVDNNKDGITDVVGPRTQFKEVLGIGLTYKF